MFRRTNAAVVAMLLAACLGAGCRSSAEPPAADEAPGKLSDFLAPYRGKVLVVLMGREGCPGTAKATATLDAYASASPADVVIVRLDVPLPKEDLNVAGEWKHPYPRRVDKGRRLADELEFFYYPTLYVYDRDGALRFTGGCDGARLDAMVREVLAEAPGAPKNNYTLPMPAAGEQAPAFAAANLAGERVTLDALRGQQATILFFARTSCPFTVEALPSVRSLAAEYAKAGVAVAVINSGETPDAIRPVYEKHAAGVPVVVDADGRVSQAYGVDMVPFFFLLDKDGKIVKRRSFTAAAASGALGELLGLAADQSRFKPIEAG
jgi:peroxiredoxin